MATDATYLDYVLEQLSELDGLTHRKMMGEYILYYQGKIAAYLCDNRLLVRPIPAVLERLPDARQEPPYAGAKKMVLVEELDDKTFLADLFRSMYDELPAPKKKK